MQDLGTLGRPWPASPAPYCYAHGINASGQVVGVSTVSPSSYDYAFLYSGGVMQRLGILGGAGDSAAHGINTWGQVVGYASTVTGVHAYLYSGGLMEDLNSMVPANTGWTLGDATAINDLGQIVGYGTNPAGYTRAFLLTPIPEPATLALLALGLTAVGRRCGRPAQCPDRRASRRRAGRR